jgi:hypothetical protein
MKKAIIGIVDSAAQAELVVEELQRTPGVSVKDISVLLPDVGATRSFAYEHNTKAPEGAMAGAGAGGLLGGTLGVLAGIGSIAIPGVGPLIAAGPLLAALSGAAAGAALGGLTGALVGMGVPEIEAKTYAGKLRGSNVLVAVHIDNGETQEQVKNLLKRYGARDIDVARESAVPSTRT